MKTAYAPESSFVALKLCSDAEEKFGDLPQKHLFCLVIDFYKEPKKVGLRSKLQFFVMEKNSHLAYGSYFGSKILDQMDLT